MGRRPESRPKQTAPVPLPGRYAGPEIAITLGVPTSNEPFST
jgi:hypothetical protein